MVIRMLLSIILLAIARQGLAVELVSSKTIETQKQLTSEFRLSNGIPVIYRTIPDSDLLQVKVSFSFGEKDLPSGQRSLLRWLMATMPMAAEGFPKKAMDEQLTKYSIEMGCAASTESSSCDLGTINDFFADSIAPFAAMISSPQLSDADLELQRDRLSAAARQEKQNPSTYINHVVNRAFYRGGHPYQLAADEIVSELSVKKAGDVRQLHSALINSKQMAIIVVGSLAKDKLAAKLEAGFAKIPSKELTQQDVKEPVFDAEKKLEFESLDLPTAYMRAKIPAPAANAPDAVAANFMFEILSQKMFEEIRSKRSLSYTPFAASLAMTIGIGVLDVSTPKPKESLQAIADVVAQLKATPLDKDDVEEYKRLYATRYFLTQESHQAMADSMARYYRYFASVEPLYELPRTLSAVTAAQVQSVAVKYLKNFRLGILYDRAKFDDSWIGVIP